MKSPRIEIAGVVLKPSGSGWGMGDLKPRNIHHEETEEIERPLYYGKAQKAVEAFVRMAAIKVAAGKGTALDYDLLGYLTHLLVTEQALGDPPSVVKRIRSSAGWSIRRMAKESGVSRKTIREIEAGGRDPKVGTLEKILSSCL